MEEAYRSGGSAVLAYMFEESIWGVLQPFQQLMNVLQLLWLVAFRILWVKMLLEQFAALLPPFPVLHKTKGPIEFDTV